MDIKKKKFIYYSSPEHWFQTALELNESLKELYKFKETAYYIQDFEFENNKSIKTSAYSRAINLLMAYALENLLKGIAILRNPDLVNSGKLKKEIKTHRLNNISNLVGYNLNKEQIEFQNVLTTQCLSNARYPVGLNENIELISLKLEKERYNTYLELFNLYKTNFATEFHQTGWNSGFKDEILNTTPKEFLYFEKDDNSNISLFT